MNICQAGHKTHDTRKVKTILGDMVIYDYKKYMGFAGYCTGQDDVSLTLDKAGEWDEQMTNLIFTILATGNRKDNWFMDIGCHIGYYSMLANSLLYPIIAVDGDKENLRLFKQNIDLKSVYPLLLWFDDKIKPFNEFNSVCELAKIDIEGNEQWAITWLENIKVNNIIMEISPVFNNSYPELINKLTKKYDVLELNQEPFDFNYNFKQKDLWLKLKNN